MVNKGILPIVGREGLHNGQVTFLVLGEKPIVYYRGGGICNTQTMLVRGRDKLGIDPLTAASWFMAAGKGDQEAIEWWNTLLETLGCAQLFENNPDQLHWVLAQLLGEEGAEKWVQDLIQNGPSYTRDETSHGSVPPPWIAGRFSSN